MNKEEVLLVAEKNNGYLHSKLMKEQDIPSVYISRLVKEKKLEKVYKGIYTMPDTPLDVYYIYSLKYPNIIYSGESALFLNDLSSKQSVKMEITLPYGVNVPEIPDAKIIVTRKKTARLGVTVVETSFGNPVKAYGKERVVCDLFVRPEHYDAEDRIFAIKEYARHYLDVENLYLYAKELGVYEEVKNVFEVISWN